MEDWQLRVVQEDADLKEKLKKLNAYLDGVTVSAENQVAISLLHIQQAIMYSYATILSARIALFKNSK